MKEINNYQVAIINEDNTIELYEKSKSEKLYFIAKYDPATKYLIYLDLYSINELVDFMKYLDSNKYYIESLIEC